MPPSEAFDALNDDDRCMALVPTPEHINPQGLIDRFSAVLSTRPSVFVRNQGLVYVNSDILGLKDYLQPAKDAVADALVEESDILLSFVQDLANEVILNHTNARTSVQMTSRIKSYNKTDIQRRHHDNNFFTAFLGSDSQGHTLVTKSGETVELKALPANHILFTRQRDWGYMHPDFNSGDGIEHSVHWVPQYEGDFRTVGLVFIGK